MIVLLTLFTTLNVLFYLLLTWSWHSIKSSVSSDANHAFSIIIPVRNEVINIRHLLACLDKQDYPKSLYEVIVVDDFSEDGTLDHVEQFTRECKTKIKCISLADPLKKGKKHALTAGIKAARFDLILTTDADCTLGNQWLQSFNNAFDDSMNVVAGPVSIEGAGLFARLQQVEFAGLIGFGAVTIHHENPSMCSGANLGFRKRAFEDVGGYENNLFTPSGDDEFLLYNIMRAFPQSARFLKQEKAIVHTKAHLNLTSFLNQRIRWTSKWKHNKNWKVRLGAVLFFFDYLLFYGAVAGALAGFIPPYFLVGVLTTRFLAMWAFAGSVNYFLGGKPSGWPLFIFQIIYPLHVLFMGMNSIFGTYTWKGRRYG